jgi:hypothetical protein
MSARTKWTTGLTVLLFASAIWAEEGIPRAEWTPQEQKMVQEMRNIYQKQKLPFTDEQASIAVKTMRDKIARMTGQIAAARAGAGMMPSLGAAATANAPQQPPSQPTATSSEADLGARYAEIPPKSGDAQIEGRSDGFIVNGRPFVDPEGPITDYAFDVVTGNIGYVVEGPAGHVLKVTRAGATTEPLKIASARETPSGWQVVTTTGKTMSGNRYSVIPTGVLVSRPTVDLPRFRGRS